MAPVHETPIWLSHHATSHERCVVVGRSHVCRRCLVLYPLAALSAALVAIAGVAGGSTWATAAMWVLPVPMVAEWVAEHARWITYSPRRQTASTALAAAGAGVALAIHLSDPFTLAAVAPMAVHASACGISALLATVTRSARRRSDGEPDWEAEHERLERERLDELTRLLEAH